MADAGDTGGGEKCEEDGTTHSLPAVDQGEEGVTALLDHTADGASYWRVATEAAGQGCIDVIQKLVCLATSAVGHAVLYALTKDAAPILAAASAGHLDIVELLLPLYTATEGSLPLRSLLTNAAASGNLDLLKYLFSLSSASRKIGEEEGWGGYSRRRHPKYDLLEGAHSAAAAGGHVHVLDWLWGREDESEEEAIKSDSPRCRFKPAEYTKLILGNRIPTEKDAADRIRVLEWVISTRGRSILSFEKSGGGIVGKMAAAGSVTVLRWLLGEHVASKRKNWGPGVFPFYPMATAAASHGHVDVLEVIASHRKECEEAAEVLRAYRVIEDAICNGHVCVVRWLFEEVGPNEVAYDRTGDYRNLPALAFHKGQVGVLEFLYLDAGVPYGEHPASVHPDAEEFFWDHASDWEAGVFPEVDVKPAAAARAQ